jgi:hypothetical protein
VDGLLPKLQDWYVHDFRLANAAFYSGRLAATTLSRMSLWSNWTSYLEPLGLEPSLQDVPYVEWSQVLTGFAQRVCKGYYRRGSQVRADTVCSALTAIGQTIALAHGNNPRKLEGSNRFIPQLQQVLDGYRKEDPVLLKKLPVEADVPEFLVDTGYASEGSNLNKAIGDLSLIAYYYLLRVGEYTTKSKHENTQQTVQFKMEDIRFFGRDKSSRLRCLPGDVSDQFIATASGATLKLDNQKNGWKGVFFPAGEKLIAPEIATHSFSVI